MKDIYQECPVYRKKIITLRQTSMEDAEELLKCYSDEKAVPFFNSDNCHGDDFYYTSIERMRKAVDFWDFSYKNKYFVRWTVIINDTNEKVGTIEMFHRLAEDEYNHYGVLRIDLQSNYEIQQVIDEILEIADENFFKAFDVKAILTKAVPDAKERIKSLIRNRYKPIKGKFMIYDDYFVNSRVQKERFYEAGVQKVTIEKEIKGDRILDIGGGGEGVIGLCYGNRVVAIDPNADELKESAGGPLKIVMDARELSFLDSTFDAVTSFFTLMYIDKCDHEKVFSEVYRVLKEDGELILWDAIIPKYDGSEKDIYVIRLEIMAITKLIKTGYGVFRKDKEQDIEYFIEMGKKAGFKVVKEEQQGQTFNLIFKK